MPGLDEEIESTVASMTEDLARKNAMVWALLSDEIQEKVKEDIAEATPKKTANEYAREYINERGMQFVTQMTDTDKAQLREIFLDNWGSPKKIAQKIDESYNVSKDRLARIYRTEMGMAKKTGKFLDAQDANMEVRDWTPIGDERTCEVCMELAAQNQGVPMDEPYTTGEMVAVGHPGGCRCIDVFRKIRDPPAYTPEDYEEEIEDIEEPEDEDVKKYGTSEGALLGWDHRGRGHKVTDEPKKERKIASPLTKIQLEELEHDYVSTNYKDTTNRGNTDIYLNKIAEIQGFTETPQLVSDSELRQYSNDNKVKILYRGINSHDHTKEFKYGAYQARTGLSGDGIYVAYGEAGEEVAISYARAVPWTQGGGSSLQPLEKGDVIKMCLDKDAKIINVDDAYKLRKEIVDKHDLESTHILNDEGRLAAIMGYDAIDIPNDEFMIVLNRTKLRVVK